MYQVVLCSSGVVMAKRQHQCTLNPSYATWKNDDVRLLERLKRFTHHQSALNFAKFRSNRSVSATQPFKHVTRAQRTAIARLFHSATNSGLDMGQLNSAGSVVWSKLLTRDRFPLSWAQFIWKVFIRYSMTQYCRGWLWLNYSSVKVFWRQTRIAAIIRFYRQS